MTAGPGGGRGRSPTRPSRRWILSGGAAALAGIAFAARASVPRIAEPTPIEVRAYPLPGFAVGEPERRAFGALTFRSGLELQSPFGGFGGFSGLWRSPDGGRIVAITDSAYWLTAEVVRGEDGRLTELANAVMAPLLGPKGEPLADGPSYDAESLAIQDGIAYVGVERTQEIYRFTFGQDGVAARGSLIRVPAEMKGWPRNKGPEALALAPRSSPAAGSLVVVAERARWEEDLPTQGLILGGSARGAFDIVRSDGFEVTDMTFLEGGDLLLLERRFSVLGGVAMRMRRLPGGELRPGALLDGPVVLQADSRYQIDNMEGLALHRGPRGETLVTLVSDNNFSILQRTLLLEFALEG